MHEGTAKKWTRLDISLDGAESSTMLSGTLASTVSLKSPNKETNHARSRHGRNQPKHQTRTLNRGPHRA